MLVRFVLAPALSLVADTFAVAAHFGGANARTAEKADQPIAREEQLALLRVKRRER
jgi:hypothetical protein